MKIKTNKIDKLTAEVKEEIMFLFCVSYLDFRSSDEI